MGTSGLKQATETTILNTNYIVSKLEAHYPVSFKDRSERGAHECILDNCVFKEHVGISVEDITKRVIDYGFMHQPCRSRLPVP